MFSYARKGPREQASCRMSRITINSNIAALNAQRSLSSASAKLFQSFTRLSSGLRINRAADDAAGLAISESLKTDTRIFQQGVRNVNDGLSVLAFADGSLEELVNVTTRLAELAEQAANGTLSSRQRAALDQEAQSLAKEYNRIARSSSFNGRALFDGDYGTLSVVAGGSRNTIIASGLGGSIGDGTFLARTSIVTGNAARGLEIADLNGDEIIDFVSADQSSNTVSVFLGNGDGTFKLRSSYFTNDQPFWVEAVDLNSDGIMDLVSADSGDGVMSVFIGNGDGSFLARTTYTAASGARSVATLDYNGDGKLDLVTADYNTNTLSVFRGNGNGSFAARTVLATGATPSSLLAIDLNSDGIMDLAVGEQGTDSVGVFLVQANGTFSARVSYAAGDAPGVVEQADFNGDGIVDLVVSEIGADSVSVFLGNGDGTFRHRLSAATGDTPYSVAVADFNGDGFADLVTSDRLDNALGIYLGNGDGSFKARTSAASGAVPTFVETADFNRDGVEDLLSVDFADNRVSVLLGNSRDGVSALQSFTLKTQQGAKDALTYLRGVLTRAGAQRAEIGAFQSRLSVAVSTLQTGAQGAAEANSRIVDADTAEEAARLTANRIIQQSANSILAQANQQPAIALSLLRDI